MTRKAWVPADGSPRVLVVDNDEEQVEELVEMFTGAGISAGAATSATQAMEMLSSLRPQLMLVDVRMPGIDGGKLANLVRALDRRVAIILMSGDWNAVADLKERDEGFLAVIRKPLDPAWLIETVRAVTH